MAWLTVLVAAVLALEGTYAFHKFHRFHFDHGKEDLNILRKHYLNKFKDVVHMDQPRIGPFNVKMTWKNCGSSSAPVTIHNLTITPDPIHIPGELHLAASVTLNEDMSAPLKAAVEMKKHFFGAWDRIPCYKGKVGSCTYDDVCALLSPKPCPDPLPKYKIPCHCPFAMGSYYLPHSTFKLKSPGHIPSWLANGEYRIQVNLSKGGKEMGCFFIELSIHF